MSHGNHLFLMAIDSDVLQDDDDDERREYIADEFSERFRSRLDENNWFRHLAVVFKDGNYVMWPDCELEIFGDTPVESRWEVVRRYALQCVAVDFLLFGATPLAIGESGNEGNKKIDALSFDELLAEIYNQIPASLSAQYHSLEGKPGGLHEIPDESWRVEHERRKTVLRFEAFRNCDCLPFTRWPMVSAYEYRAFDITWGEEPNAILITDIHT